MRPKKILENIPVYPTDEYSEDWVLKLDANENLFGPSGRVLECFRNLECKNFNLYPCYGELLDELSKLHGVRKENILLTNGCDEAISVVLNTYLEQGDKVASFSPTFIMPKIYTQALGGEFVEVEYPDKWRFDADKLIKAAAGAKVVLITSPNSPTGELVGKSDIIKILKSCPNSLVMLDNTYINYSDEPFVPQELVEAYPNLFVVKSFSKDYALAGLRLGYVMGQGVGELKKVVSPYSVNSLAVLAGLESLKDTKHFENIKKEVITSKELLHKGLKDLGYKPYESQTNFLLCDFGEKAEFLYKKLLSKSIKVKKFDNADLKNCFRITVPSVENCELLLNALKPKELLIFDLDGVVFDVRNSYRVAIEKTFEHFAGRKVVQEAIQEAKNSGGLNCDWDLTQYLLSKEGFDITLEEVTRVFQGLFFNGGHGGLIDKEGLLLDPGLLKEFSRHYDFAVFTGRPYDEAMYSLKKFGLEKYFTAVVTKDDLAQDRQKPCPDGLEMIKKKCVYTEVTYFGDTSDDMKSAVSANVNAVGVLPPQDKSDRLKISLQECGASAVVDDINTVLRGKICV